MLPSDPHSAMPPVRNLPVVTDGGTVSNGIPTPLANGMEATLTGLPPAMASEAMGEALLQAFRRRWLRAFGLGVVGAALAAGAVWFLMPPRYTAQALLHVANRQPRGIFVSTEGGYDDPLAYQRTQATLVKSRVVMQAALRQPQVAALSDVQSRSDAGVWLQQSLVVDTTLGSELLGVNLSGDRPEDLPILLNAAVQAYLREIVNTEQTKQQARLEQLLANYRRAEDALRQKRTTLKDLEISLGIEDPQLLAVRYRAGLEKLNMAEKEHLQARVSLQGARLELAAERAKVKAPPPVVVTEAAVEQYLKQDIAYTRLLTRLGVIEEEIANLQTVATAGVRASYMEGYQRQRDQAEKELSARRKAVRPLVEAQEHARVSEEIRTNVAKLETGMSVLEEKEKAVAAEVRRLDMEVKQLAASIRQPDKPMADVEALRDEVSQGEQALKKVGEQLKTIEVEPVLPSRVTLLEPAEVPQTRDLRQQTKYAGLAGVAVFGFLVVGVTWREYRNRRVYAVNDVVHGLGMNLVGTVPALRMSGRRSFPVGAPGRAVWQTLLTESVDAIRAQFLHAAQKDGLQVLMVTSAAGGEGKTSLATHLAASLARARRDTLLVDGDLRNPGVHRPFDLPAAPGLSEVLRGEAKVEDVIRPTPLGHLTVLTAGKWDREAVQALAHDDARNLFMQLKERYEFVILDSSPVLPVADSLLLGQHADAVIFSVLQDVSRIPSIYAAQQRLATLGIRLLGTVVLGTGEDVFDYQYPVADA